MFSGMQFDFPLSQLFSLATDNINLIMPILSLILGVLIFDLVTDRVISGILKVISFITGRTTEDDEGE